MATGTAPKSALVTKEEMRKKYGIPQDAFVISYVGRHNEIKGYDALKEIGKHLLDANDSACVYCRNRGAIVPFGTQPLD